MTRKKHKQKDPLRGADPELARRVLQHHPGVAISALPESVPKISGVVSEFAQPLFDAYSVSKEMGPTVMGIGCLLWNMAVFKAIGSREYSETESFLMETLGQEPFLLEPDEALNLISAMLKRWNEEFSWCRRLIMDWKASVKGGRLNLSVYSALATDVFQPEGGQG